ncbi:hypothetical protein Tco_1556928 [Tanacetum coccineum]
MSDISVVRDFIDVFLEDLSMTTTTTSGVPHRFGLWSDVSCEVSIFPKRGVQQKNLLAERLSWVRLTYEKEGGLRSFVLYGSYMILLLGNRERILMKEAHNIKVKVAMSKTFGLLQQPEILEVENDIESPLELLSVNFQDNSKEWNSGDDQLRFRWMIYLVVLVDAAESVSDAIGFEYCLASSSGWTKHFMVLRFEALYGRKCRSPVIWAKIRGSSLIRPELVQETTNKEVLIKEKLKVARDHQKSYTDNRRKPLEFEVGDRPFEILKRIGPVAYRLRLPEELSGVHDMFHVSNLKKCLADASLHVPLDEIKVDKTLRFVEELVEIMDREVKRLKCSIMLVRVQFGLKRVLETSVNGVSTHCSLSKDQ